VPSPPSAPEPTPPPAPAPPTPTPFPQPTPPAEPPPAASAVNASTSTFDGSGAPVNLNTVTFEQLRGENLTVTQATRLLAHRERLGGFQSVDDLNQVAGFPGDLLEDLKRRSTV
jgi:competence protein ComEA